MLIRSESSISEHLWLSSLRRWSHVDPIGFICPACVCVCIVAAMCILVCLNIIIILSLARDFWAARTGGSCRGALPSAEAHAARLCCMSSVRFQLD